MSKVLGIVAEYNPFHNGHFYHIEKSKELTNCDYTVAIISGNFTQRGLPSIINKWEKTKMALSNNVDLVIELPTLYAISSAENFSDGAIKILNSLGIINYISFGSETDNISILGQLADILYNEPTKYKEYLNKESKKGLSFPAARENALINYIRDLKDISIEDLQYYKNVLSSPNNILGIEYLKALKKYNSKIEPISIQRFKSNYNSKELSDNIASSTAIRELIKNKDFDSIKKVLPKKCYENLINNFDNGDIIVDLKIFEKQIIYILRKMSIDEIKNLPDVSEGLEISIKNAANSCNNLETLISKVKSKRYVQSRIQRIFLYALLGITKDDMKNSKTVQPYIRVLGFNKNGEYLLSKIVKNNPDLKIITSAKKFIDNNKNNDLYKLINLDILATNLYSSECKTNFEANLDFKNGIIKL